MTDTNPPPLSLLDRLYVSTDAMLLRWQSVNAELGIVLQLKPNSLMTTVTREALLIITEALQRRGISSPQDAISQRKQSTAIERVSQYVFAQLGHAELQAPLNLDDLITILRMAYNEDQAARLRSGPVSDVVLSDATPTTLQGNVNG